MRPSSSSLSRRWRYLTKDIVRSDPWRHRTRVMVWIVLLAAIVVAGVLIMQPDESGQNVADPHLAFRAAQTTRAPVPTVLPAASPPTTLVPATAAEESAFKAGQRSCQRSPSTTLAPAGATEQAAFKAGHQWCHSLTTVSHHVSQNKR